MRGTGVNDLFDLRPCAFRILNHLIRPEAHDIPALALHSFRSASIRFNLKGMMIAIDLDDEPSRDAGEVREVGTNRMLSAELRAGDTTCPQKFPDFALGATTVAT